MFTVYSSFLTSFVFLMMMIFSRGKVPHRSPPLAVPLILRYPQTHLLLHPLFSRKSWS